MFKFYVTYSVSVIKEEVWSSDELRLRHIGDNFHWGFARGGNNEWANWDGQTGTPTSQKTSTKPFSQRIVKHT